MAPCGRGVEDPAPNSPVTYLVTSVSVVNGSKTYWTKRLWLPCSIIAVHALPDRSRIHAKTKLLAMMMIVKHVRPPPLAADGACDGARQDDSLVPLG